MAAIAAALNMAAERGGPAALDRAHSVALHGGQRTPVPLPVCLAVAAEHVRHLRGTVRHGLGAQASAQAACAAGVDAARSASSGLAVAHTLLVARRRYLAVVLRLRWPSSNWMVRRSAPLSSR